MSGFHIAWDVFVTACVVALMVMQHLLVRRWRALAEDGRDLLALERRISNSWRVAAESWRTIALAGGKMPDELPPDPDGGPKS